jgi:hypothetical protein
MKRLVVSLVLLASISACSQPTVTAPAPTLGGQDAHASQTTGVTAHAQLDITGSAGRQVLQVPQAPSLKPWRKTDIHHVTLDLYRGQTLVGSQDISQADLARTVQFSNLVRNTTYQVVARAYSSPGTLEAIDNGALDAASCTTTFTTQESPEVFVGSLHLRLRDKIFSGTSNGVGIQVTDGLIQDTTLTEGMTLSAPTQGLSGVSLHFDSIMGMALVSWNSMSSEPTDYDIRIVDLSNNETVWGESDSGALSQGMFHDLFTMSIWNLPPGQYAAEVWINGTPIMAASQPVYWPGAVNLIIAP